MTIEEENQRATLLRSVLERIAKLAKEASDKNVVPGSLEDFEEAFDRIHALIVKAGREEP